MGYERTKKSAKIRHYSRTGWFGLPGDSPASPRTTRFLELERKILTYCLQGTHRHISTQWSGSYLEGGETRGCLEYVCERLIDRVSYFEFHPYKISYTRRYFQMSIFRTKVALHTNLRTLLGLGRGLQKTKN